MRKTALLLITVLIFCTSCNSTAKNTSEPLNSDAASGGSNYGEITDSSTGSMIDNSPGENKTAYESASAVSGKNETHTNFESKKNTGGSNSNETQPANEPAAQKKLNGISIAEMPIKTEYAPGENYDGTGLAINLLYSNGEVQVIEKGFNVYGFSSGKIGLCTITVEYKGFKTSYNVEIKSLDADLYDIRHLVSEDVKKSVNQYDVYGNYYDRALLFFASPSYTSKLICNLGGKYEKFKCTIAVKSGDGYDGSCNFIVNIYSDDKLIFSKQDITNLTEPLLIDLDVSNCNNMKILVSETDLFKHALIFANSTLVAKK